MESFSQRGVSLTAPLEVREPMRRVALTPQKTTTQLGFGCAYLLGPGIDRAKSLRLLEAAYDAGVRHFDTARLYGQGECEALLGEFLRRKPEATLTTKFGLEPPNLVQRSGTAAARRVRGLEGFAKRLRGNGKVTFHAKDARASLERSLRALGREQIELFLLHEPERTELVHDDLLAFLEEARDAGKIGNFGIGGEYSRVAELYATRRAYTPVMQFEHSIFGPSIAVPESLRVHYRTFARAASALTARFTTDPRLGWWWSEMVGADLREPRVLAQLLLRASLDEYPEALTLFSTSSEQHIYENAAVAQDSALAEPARRLRKLVREDDLGVGAELYG
jgi:aryl-alcohol dehydrogenase-like predicted oxidoreductase